MLYIPLTIAKLGVHFPNPLGYFLVTMSVYNKHPVYYHLPAPWKVSLQHPVVPSWNFLTDKHPVYLDSNPEVSLYHPDTINNPYLPTATSY